jgi:hypothetical protein
MSVPLHETLLHDGGLSQEGTLVDALLRVWWAMHREGTTRSEAGDEVRAVHAGKRIRIRIRAANYNNNPTATRTASAPWLTNTAWHEVSAAGIIPGLCLVPFQLCCALASPPVAAGELNALMLGACSSVVVWWWWQWSLVVVAGLLCASRWFFLVRLSGVTHSSEISPQTRCRAHPPHARSHWL